MQSPVSRGKDGPSSSQRLPYTKKQSYLDKIVPEQRALCIALQYKNLQLPDLDSEFHGAHEDALKVQDMLIRKNLCACGSHHLILT